MASPNVIELSAENFDQEVINSEIPVMVDFWAPWCGPCRMLAPTVYKVADQFAGKVKVAKLNTDDAPEIAARYAISGIPQLLFFHGGGGPKEKLVGVQPESTIVKTLNRLLGV